MNELLLYKLDELYKYLGDTSLVKELLKLKEKIYNDLELKEKLNKYRNISNKYDPEFLNLKKDIINNPLIKKYRKLENELYFITLEINKKLNDLIDKKRCNVEDN